MSECRSSLVVYARINNPPLKAVGGGGSLIGNTPWRLLTLGALSVSVQDTPNVSNQPSAWNI